MAFPARLERQRRNLIDHETRLIDPYPRSSGIRILLCYPNHYSLAMSSLAWQGVYHLFNSSPLFECHRSTLEFSSPLGSIETGQSFNDYDVVAFHFSYELDYLNFLEILRNNRIPACRQNRTGRYPIFMAGGLCISVFPDVVEPFFDVMVRGEAECLIRQMEEEIDAGEAIQLRSDRRGMLELFSRLDNLWVPDWNLNRGIQRIHSPMNDSPLFTPLSSRERHFRSEFLLEVSRGCPSGCSFCAASHLNKPTRFRSRDSLIETLRQFIPNRISQVGLVGAALAFHPDLKTLLNDLLGLNLQAHLSSLRPEIIDQELCRLLDRHQVKTITLAPETGNDQDRFKLNKRLTNQKLLDSIRLLAEFSSVRELKLYVMLGFDFDDEVGKIAELTTMIQAQFNRTVTLSVTPFIPKKMTPFQDRSFCEPARLKMMYRDLKKLFPAGRSSIRLNLFSIRQSAIQAELSSNPDALMRGENKNSRS